MRNGASGGRGALGTNGNSGTGHATGRARSRPRPPRCRSPSRRCHRARGSGAARWPPARPTAPAARSPAPQRPAEPRGRSTAPVRPAAASRCAHLLLAGSPMAPGSGRGRRMSTMRAAPAHRPRCAMRDAAPPLHHYPRRTGRGPRPPPRARPAGPRRDVSAHRPPGAGGAVLTSPRGPQRRLVAAGRAPADWPW